MRSTAFAGVSARDAQAAESDNLAPFGQTIDGRNIKNRLSQIGLIFAQYRLLRGPSRA